MTETLLLANGYFLAKRTYSITDKKTNLQKDLITYDLLVYDEMKDWGIMKPQIVKITVPQDKPIDITGVKIFSKVVVNFELKEVATKDEYGRPVKYLKPSYTTFKLA